MGAKSMIKRALNRSAQGTTLPKITTGPTVTEVILAPALGYGDTAMIFRSHLATLSDGAALVAGLDRMVQVAPAVAGQVFAAGSLGEVSRGRAVRSVRDYLVTRVAVAPLGL